MFPTISPGFPTVQQPQSPAPPPPTFVNHATAGTQLGCPNCVGTDASLGEIQPWPLWTKIAVGAGIFAAFVTFFVVVTKESAKYGLADD